MRTSSEISVPATIAERLRIQVVSEASRVAELAEDTRRGLGRRPKSVPAKYFYDERGAELFDLICNTEEYYPTRTEYALLQSVSQQVLEIARPRDIVELGSGAARKTRVLLDAVEQSGRRCRYIPFDVTLPMLKKSSLGLLQRYAWLQIHGIVGDYERHLAMLPTGSRRLFVFLGSTIGNYDVAATQSFLRGISCIMQDGDFLLLGTDTVKDRTVLHSAYNDASGVTAAFNKNLLSVLNRELGAGFDLEDFAHEAFFNEEEQQIEMHLRACREHTVSISSLGMEIQFERDERLRTEISRKFTRSSVESMLGTGGLELLEWLPAPNDWFALSLAKKSRAQSFSD